MEMLEEDPFASMPPLPQFRHYLDSGERGRTRGQPEGSICSPRLSQAEWAHRRSVASLLRQSETSTGAPDGLFDDALFRDPVLEEALYELTGASPRGQEGSGQGRERSRGPEVPPGYAAVPARACGRRLRSCS